MADLNKNGVPDEVDVARANAEAHQADVQKARLELEKARLSYQVPLYDRVVMRLMVPFCLAFAAPVATYYFGSQASAGLEHVERLDRAVERLERLVLRNEIRARAPTLPQASADRLADEFIQRQEQHQQAGNESLPPDLDKFLQDQNQVQEQRR